MRRTRFFYNAETLKFEKAQKPLRQRIRNGLFYFAALSVLFIGIRLILDRDFSSPKVKYFSQKNSELKEEYEKLNSKINLAENFLTEIQKRDDKVYRSVFDLEPIPRSVREAGFGGSDNYFSDLYSGNKTFVKLTARKLAELSTKARVQSISFTDIYRKAKEQQLLIARKPSINPISPADHVWLTSSFGYRRDPFNGKRRMHYGIDLAGKVGIHIYATGEGVVKVAEHNRYGYGKEIILEHGFGYQSIYAHLDDIFVNPGDTVKRGQLIGTLGSTGRSTGPHLHYEIRQGDRAVNPMYYFYEDLSVSEYKMITSSN